MPPAKTLKEKIKDKFVIDKETGCHNWIGAKNPDGYGEVIDYRGGDRRYLRAHRISLELKLGRRIAPTLNALHHCDNPSCINPEHLYEGSFKDNSMDMLKRGRNYFTNKTHCKWGHEYNEQNTGYQTGRNGRRHRRCKTCDRIVHKRLAKKKLGLRK